MFSDEVWATGGAHTVSYVTVEDGGDNYSIENLQHQYSEAQAWMFHGTIVDGKKGPARFWEKEWGNINSTTYNKYILSHIDEFFREHTEGYFFMQDNPPSHRSVQTILNLVRRDIPYIMFPPYSPDLNLTEHVWNWMKNWIEERYWQIGYNVAKIPLEDLQTIIWDAWNAVPEDYIQSLYDSWWDRCKAVIEAKGGPTKY